jgi:glycosyltransferase involved in cell wall biosynthesis
MRICVVTSSRLPPEEGIGNYIYNMSKEFIRKGHKVTVITRGKLNKVEKDTFEGIELYKVPFVLLYPFHVHIHGIFVNELLKTIEDNFDVIHIHTPLPPIIKSQTPTVLTFHSSMIDAAKVLDRLDLLSLATKFQAKYISYPIEKRLLKNSNLITAVSKKVATDLTGYGLSLNNVKVIYNGVDENIFLPTGKKNKEKYVLYTGRISHSKGLVELIDCAKEVLMIRNDIRFILAGSGPLLNQLSSEVRNLHLEDHIEFLGQVSRNDIVNLYQNAHLFVFPSHYEGLPGSLLEAMSCELPIVATKVPGNIELIEHNVNGILVPPKNVGALTEAILKLLDDFDLRNRLGEKARDTVIKRGFTWDGISNNILQCYQSIQRIGK